MPTIAHIAAPPSWISASRNLSITNAEAMFDALLCSDESIAALEHREASNFSKQLHTYISTPARSVVVDFPPGLSINVACMLVSRCLGDVHQNRESPLWNPVDIDVSTEAPARATLEKLGAGHFPVEGEIWHSDGAPWLIPNRWTVVGITHLAPECPEVKTAILPFERLIENWRSDAGLLNVLQQENVNWRQIFPNAVPLLAPVLGESINRWMPIIQQHEFDDNVGPMGQACRAVAEMLNAATSTQLYQTVLKPGHVLVFDNHKVLHRANADAGPELRRITRIRIGGQPT